MPLISDSIGRVLGKRYRLLSALGTGASAHVYLAEDVSLQRHVAVKVLQPGLATDEAFLKRFRAEARSVASLNHPHVLRVFDWGEDTDGPYLVLEYLGGGSLRDLLDRDIRLSLSQAAQLGTEVAQGLAYAHLRGLVHRDIKPANLFFDEEGRVRVADFGVARALAEAAWTEPAGAMVGTARYISPEAAEGKPVDGRADVYSLALVLYEAVTGVVPFVTDTTMGTLAARIGQPLPHNDLLGPLDDVLARAAAPDVASRLDAAGLAARLGALAAALPTPSALPLIMPKLEDSAPINGFRAPGVSELTDSGVAWPGPPAPRPAAPSATARRSPRDWPRPARRSGRRRARASSSTPSRATRPGPSSKRKRRRGAILSTGGPSEPYKPKPSKKWWWIGGAVAAGADSGRRALRRLRDQRAHAVASDADGRQHALAQAKTAVDKVHMNLEGGRTGDVDHCGGRRRGVAEPEAGGVAEGGLDVNVVLSAGKPDVTVPSLSGMTCAQAATALQSAHFQSVCAPGTTATPCRPRCWCCGRSTRPRTRPRRPTAPPSRSCPRWATSRPPCPASRPATRSPRRRPRCRRSA